MQNVPRATYRLQLHPGFDFQAAAGVADYLADLGVSHVYSSPYLQATSGSTHGYDVVDPTRVNRELGGKEGHVRFCEALGEAGLGQVLDIVPNHMAVGTPENRWWWDVLRNGPASAYARFFDVDWDPPEPKLRNQVLLPILGDHYGRELEAGDVRLHRDGGTFTIRYHEHILPVAPRSLAEPLAGAAERLERRDGAGPEPPREVETDGVEELAFLARALDRLPEPADSHADTRETRQRDLQIIDRRLEQMLSGRVEVAEAVDEMVTELNADPDAMDALLGAQNYRLAYWRTGRQELDYRRFFDIDTLAGLRTEDERVFRAVHRRVLEWLEAGVLDGVRVDHPDGLRRPAQYFRRLREAAPDAWVVAEKIVMPDEPLRDWPIHGTTGYEVLNDITGLFVDPAGEEPLTGLWQDLTGDDRSFHEVAYEARQDVLRRVLAADLNRLANIFVQLCESHRRYRDFTRRELREALAEVAACFPVYRTYVTEDAQAAPEDRDLVERAVAAAGERRPDLDPELLEFLEGTLLGEDGTAEARGLRMRFQQFTGPVAAKGEEDTAFYRYMRFSALNEVGGDPGRWGLSPSSFHERAERRARHWPAAMSTLSTHDTKRSEDVRARLLVLAEIPRRWTEAVGRWREMNRRHWPSGVEPDAAMEYLLYQTAVGAWPIGADRLGAYLEKASREAKLRTTWTEPDEAYDEALQHFIRAVLDSEWADEVERFVEPLVGAGRVVSLSQKLVQLTMPGVPDIYQGTELWDLSLVDPDNRRPVDFDARRELLGRLEPLEQEPDPATILKQMDSGLPKLWVVRQALRARAERPEAFGLEGDYRPIELRGSATDHAFGYVRGGQVAVLVPRLVIGLARSGGWGDAVAGLPEGQWINRMTGERVEGGDRPVASLLARFPVALLVKQEEGRR